MFGALVEFERSLICERTQASLAAARRVGRKGGHPPKLRDEDVEIRQGDACQSRYRGDSNRAPPWRLSRDALSLHPRRVHSEYAGRLRTALYSQIGRLRDDFSPKDAGASPPA
jgi:hypothetical protein